MNASVKRLTVVFLKDNYGLANFMLADPINETTSKNRQIDVFLLVFVSADNNNVSARLTTDLFIKNWVDQLHAADPKAAYDSKINPTE